MSDKAKQPGKGGHGEAGHKPANRDYEVGYGKPPKSGQFKPGVSPNPAGRPASRDHAIDIDAILDQPVEVISDGKRETVEPTKVKLLAQIKEAKDGKLPPLAHVLAQFIEHGVLGSRKEKRPSGVVTLPNTMPFPMAQIMAQRFGRARWTKAQLAKGRAQYVKQRSDKQAQIDDAIGYPDL